MRPYLGGLFLSLAAAVQLQAQAPVRQPAGPPPAAPGEIVGAVVDAKTSGPIGAASVEVRSAADSSLVAGALAQPDGKFRIEGLRPGSYLLRVTMLGYATTVTPPVSITAASPRAAVGRVALAVRAIEMEGVVASAERAMVIAPDRNIYRAKDVAPAAVNASDVLEHVPSVNVDADGKVSLRGNENVVVQVNGRPTPIRGAQLAGYLKQLPANTIERVEVVTSPSAKQDPEGMAGIINIVMKQGVDLGTSGGLTVAASTADRYSTGFNVGHQSGPLALFLNYGYLTDERTWSGANDRTRLVAGNPLSYTEQDLRGNAGNEGHNLSVNADYSFNKRDVLSTTLQFNHRGATDGSFSAYNILSGSRQRIDAYDRLRDQDRTARLGDALLAFKRTIVPQKHEIAAEVRFNAQDEAEWTELWRATSGAVNRSDVETNDLDAATNQLTAQFDYTRPLGQAAKLETGYKGNARWLDRDFEVLKDAQGLGDWTPSELSNALEFDERVNAGYAVLSRSGKKFDAQGGLRLEHARRDFSLRSSAESFPHSYNSLFPSALVSWKANDKTQLKLSYSRRIRRPGTQELNPFPVFFDLQNVFLGNPELNPEYTDALELGYQRSTQPGTLQLTPFFRRTTNIIRVDINTADVVSGREVTSISFTNLDHSSSWGADLNSQLRYKAVSGLAAFNVFKMVTDGGSESALSSNAVSWSARFNATVNVSKSTALLGSYFYQAPMNIERGKFFSQAMANFSVRQRVYGTKGTIVARVSDPFKQMKFKVRAEDDNVIQFTDRAFNSRALHLSFQYSVGQTPRLRQRTQQEEPQGTTPFGR